MSAQAQRVTNPATANPNWQVDIARGQARHVSGLVVQWQMLRQGAGRFPALDIGGLQKLNGTPWASQVNTLVDEAIALLQG